MAASKQAHRRARQARAGGDLLDVAVPACLLVAGVGSRLAGAGGGRAWVVGVAAVVVVGELAAWPLRASLDARVELGPQARRAGAAPSTAAFAACFLALALARLVVSATIAIGAVAIIRHTPWWPLWSAGLVALAGVAGALLQSRVGIGLGALGAGNPASPEMTSRFRALAERGGLVAPDGAPLWVASDRASSGEGGRLVGLGRHRRLLLDRAVAVGDPADLDVVVAHELGHWRHRHGAAALVRSSLVVALALGALQALLRATGVDPGSPASLPAVWLGAALLAVPARLALAAASRRDELRADRFAAGLVGGGAEQVADHLRRHLLSTGADLRPSGWDRLGGCHPAPRRRLEALVPVPGATERAS